jgi:hypothetical protein
MIPDGFTMNAGLRYLPYRFFPLALDKMDFLRQSGGRFRAKAYVSPVDFRVLIPPFDRILDQVHILPGSWLWGLGFCAVIYSPPSATIPQGPQTAYVQISDPCDDSSKPRKLFSSDVIATAVSALLPSLTSPSGLSPVLLSEPHLIGGKGEIDVEITNRGSGNLNVQLVLQVAEPCEVIE